jgi:hypothetical protein
VEGGGAGDSSRFGALGGFPGDLICAGEVCDDEADSEAVRGGGDAARPLPIVPPRAKSRNGGGLCDLSKCEEPFQAM